MKKSTVVILSCTFAASTANAGTFDYKTFDPGNPAASNYVKVFEDNFDDQSKFNYSDGSCTGPKTWNWHSSDNGWGACTGTQTLSTNLVTYETNVSGAEDGKAIAVRFPGGSSNAFASMGWNGSGENVDIFGANGGYFEPGWFLEFRLKFDARKNAWRPNPCSEGNGKCWPGLWAMGVEWNVARLTNNSTWTDQWRGRAPGMKHWFENDVAEFMYMDQYGTQSVGNSMNDWFSPMCTTVRGGTWANGVGTITTDTQLTVGSPYNFGNAPETGWRGWWTVIDSSANSAKVRMPNNPGSNLTGATWVTGPAYDDCGYSTNVSNSLRDSGGSNVQQLGRLLPDLNFENWVTVQQLWVPGDASNGNRGFIQLFVEGKPIARYTWLKDPTFSGLPNAPYYGSRMDDHHYYLIMQSPAAYLSYTSATAAWSANEATFTVTRNYPVDIGDTIDVKNMSPSAYNGTYTVTNSTTDSNGTYITVSLPLGGDPGAGTMGELRGHNAEVLYDYVRVWQRPN